MKNDTSGFQVIPAIDLLDGQVVRLTQGDYTSVSQYAFDPVSLAKQFESDGAEKIHIVDLNGAKTGNLVHLPIIDAIRNAVNCQIEFGGGIRSLEVVKQLIALGINYVILGSMLIKDPEMAKKIIHQFPEQIIAGLDAKNEMIAISGWQEKSHLSVIDCIHQFKKRSDRVYHLHRY